MQNKEYLVFTHLQKLASCDLTVGWSLVEGYLKKHLGKKKLKCIPFISDGSMYDVFAIFVKTSQTGLLLKHPTFRVCGKLEDYMNEELTDEEWKTPPCDTSRIPHLPGGITITLMDLSSERMIRASFQGFQRKSIPSHHSPVHKVQLKMRREIYGHTDIYMVNEAITAASSELHMVVGTSSRIFYVGEPQPIMFGYQKYHINSNGNILGKRWISHDLRRISWDPILLDYDSMRGPQTLLD